MDVEVVSPRHVPIGAAVKRRPCTGFSSNGNVVLWLLLHGKLLYRGARHSVVGCCAAIVGRQPPSLRWGCQPALDCLHLIAAVVEFDVVVCAGWVLRVHRDYRRTTWRASLLGIHHCRTLLEQGLGCSFTAAFCSAAFFFASLAALACFSFFFDAPDKLPGLRFGCGVGEGMAGGPSAIIARSRQWPPNH